MGQTFVLGRKRPFAHVLMALAVLMALPFLLLFGAIPAIAAILGFWAIAFNVMMLPMQRPAYAAYGFLCMFACFTLIQFR